MTKLVEHLGIDWFVVLFRNPNFEDSQLPYPSTIAEVRDKFGDLWDEEKLNDAIGYCTSLIKREDERLDKIESKAFTLLGVTGIAAGFIIAFAGLLFDWGNVSSTTALVVASLLYISVVVSLMLTIFLATKVVNIGAYRFTYPSANDIFNLVNADLRYVKRERAVSLFYSFAQNVRVVNRKATYLGGAQIWFRNSIMLLLATTLFFAAIIPFSSSSLNPVPVISNTPTSTITPTNTFSPTDIPTNTPTSTSIPTATPTSTYTPTFTPSPTLTITVTPSATQKGTPAP